MRILAMSILYPAAFAFLWVGVQMAPPVGWPTNDVELNGCAALVLGVILKSAGHWQLLRFGRR